MFLFKCYICILIKILGLKTRIPLIEKHDRQRTEVNASNTGTNESSSLNQPITGRWETVKMGKLEVECHLQFASGKEKREGLLKG